MPPWTPQRGRAYTVMVMVLTHLSSDYCVHQRPTGREVPPAQGLQLCSGLTGDVASSHCQSFIWLFIIWTHHSCVVCLYPTLPFVSTASMVVLYHLSEVQLCPCRLTLQAEPLVPNSCRFPLHPQQPCACLMRLLQYSLDFGVSFLTLCGHPVTGWIDRWTDR